MRIVLDTNVLVAALRSKRGASYAIISMIPSGRFTSCVSVTLFNEWHDVVARPDVIPPGITSDDVAAFIDFIALKSHRQEVYFRLRPELPDPGDDHLVELAFAARATHIVTHNVRDFVGVERLGIEAVTPAHFLRLLEQRP